MNIRIEPELHPLSDGRICACLRIIVRGVAFDMAWGWGRTWQEAIRDCVRRYRVLKKSSAHVQDVGEVREAA